MASTATSARANQRLSSPPDTFFLLLAHLICADQQIHIQESLILRKWSETSLISEATQKYIEAVLSKDKTLTDQTLVQLADQVPELQRLAVFKQLLIASYADGYFSPQEQVLMEQLAINWGLTVQQADQLIAEARQEAECRAKQKPIDKQLSTDLNRLFKSTDRQVRSLLASQATPQAIGALIQSVSSHIRDIVEQNLLFAGPEYDQAVVQCREIAQQDFGYLEPALDNVDSSLSQLDKNLEAVLVKFKDQFQDISKANRKAGVSTHEDANSLKTAIAQVESTQTHLHQKILRDIEDLKIERQAKMRHLDHFSIAFMGKTKVGKSTIHSILTHSGWESIGTGKQRTTRYNRIYEWKNLRIIDTPGIGAPEGQDDTKTALSVMDETDVLCYVVTNDSIQESEFEFLKLLRTQAKPVLILLNIKKNLRDERRLALFLKDPAKAFQLDGQSGIGGTIQRIERYAREHYPNGYVEIIPVMLLAAQLAQEAKYVGQSNALERASQIQNFLKRLRASVVEHGVMRRSQTLLGSSAIKISAIQDQMHRESALYEQASKTLSQSLKMLQPQLQSALQDAHKSLTSELDQIFEDMLTKAESFAERYWEESAERQTNAWQKEYRESGFEKSIQASIEKISKVLQLHIEEALKEMRFDLSSEFKFNSEFQSFSKDGPSWGREHWGWASITLGAAGAVLSFFIPAFAVAFVGSSAIAVIFSWFSEKKIDRKRKGVSAITQTLRKQISSQQKHTQEQAIKALTEQYRTMEKQVNQYFLALVEGQKNIGKCLNQTSKEIEQETDKLNRAYALRILCWGSGRSISFSECNLHDNLERVVRIPGQSITLHLKHPIKLQRGIDEMSRILQETLIIHQPEFLKPDS